MGRAHGVRLRFLQSVFHRAHAVAHAPEQASALEDEVGGLNVGVESVRARVPEPWLHSLLDARELDFGGSLVDDGRRGFDDRLAFGCAGSDALVDERGRAAGDLVRRWPDERGVRPFRFNMLIV